LNFRAVRYATSWRWNRNASTTLKNLYISRSRLFLVNDFKVLQVLMNILCDTESKIIFIWIISIFLKVLNTILVLIDHINFALIDDRNRSNLFLYSNRFITDLALNGHRFLFKFFQLWVSVLTTFITRLLGHVYYLLLNQVWLFVFMFNLL